MKSRQPMSLSRVSLGRKSVGIGLGRGSEETTFSGNGVLVLGWMSLRREMKD